jgi:serine phosphatase RsbU (regulator of sigma subunit)/Tfp pilus assembly protein PilF
MKLSILFIFLLNFIFCQAQKECISIFKKFKSANNDTLKIQFALEVGNCYYDLSATDSAKKYYEIALQYINLSKKKEYKNIKKINKYESTVYRKIGELKSDEGYFDEAISWYKKSLNCAITNNILDEQNACYNDIAIVYHKKGKPDSSIIFFFKALKIDELLKDNKGIAMRYNNIGNIYFSQKTYDKALEYYQKSLEIKQKLKDTSGISFSYMNIGAVYYSKNDFDKALEYFNKSLELKKLLKDTRGIILLYNNIGLIYRKRDKLDEALHYYNLSLDLAKELNDKYKMAMINENIAEMYYHYASKIQDPNKSKKYYKIAIQYSEKAFRLSKDLNAIEYIYSTASTLFRSYFAIGNYKKGMQYLNEYLISNDSLFNKTKTQAIAEAEKKFETEKKQLLIDNLTKERKLQNSELKRQKIIIWSVIFGLIMTIIFSILMVQRFHITRKQKRIIEKQKEMVDEKNMLLQKQNEEIKAQHEIVVKQKEHIEQMHKKLTDSINYAQKIQEAMLPTKDDLNQLLNKYFLIYLPKDIISGDFYWTTKVNNHLIVAVADCTGHGVPGAFMSILGISLLNDIVRKKEIIKAAQVLIELRKEIILALQQYSATSEQKDGMDISLFVINTETYDCQWSGANNPIIILRKNKTTNQWEQIEIKPDKMPVAIYPVMREFTNHEFKLEKGDRIYLFSDGFADQIGYINNKKFFSKRFKEIILNTANMSLNEQKNTLLTTLKEWKGPIEQTDDITIMAVEF